MTNHFHHN